MCSVRYKVLELLMEEEDYISGEKISKIFEVSRSYIWKCINSLREEGYEIESIQNKGYRLKSSPDRLSYVEIKSYLDTDFIARELDYFDSIDSTNNYAKSIARDVEEGRIVVAEEQTGGRGRLGRSWSSTKYKGIYFSLILKPGMAPSEVARLTLVASSAVVLALDEMGIHSLIKWPNDIIVNGKKVCGILTEMSAELNHIDYIIMGVGINVNNSLDSFGEEVRYKATSLSEEESRTINRQELLGRILNNFERLYKKFLDGDFGPSLEIARERSILIDREFRLVDGDRVENVFVKDIDDRGELVVIGEDGRERRVYSGEISIRGKDSYI